MQDERLGVRAVVWHFCRTRKNTTLPGQEMTAPRLLSNGGEVPVVDEVGVAPLRAPVSWPNDIRQSALARERSEKAFVGTRRRIDCRPVVRSLCAQRSFDSQWRVLRHREAKRDR